MTAESILSIYQLKSSVYVFLYWIKVVTAVADLRMRMAGFTTMFTRSRIKQ